MRAGRRNLVPLVTEKKSVAYVRDPIMGLVRVINTATDEVSIVQLVDVRAEVSGGFPSLTGLAAGPDGKRVYIAMGDLFVLDTAGNTVVTRVAMEGLMADPTNVAVNVAVAPDGSHVYVVGRGDIIVLDTATNKIVATIPAGRGSAVSADTVITPDGKRAFLTGSPGFVSVVDLASENSMTSIELTPQRLLQPTGITIAPDGKHIYVASEEGVVSVLDADAGLVESTISVGDENDQQRGITITPDGRRVYVARFGANAVSVLDTTTHTTVTTISVNTQGGPGDRPWGIAIAPDGARAYVTSLRGHVCVLDTVNVAQIGVIGGTFGDGIAVAQISL
jgi:YVTN family beta-propeller protein